MKVIYIFLCRFGWRWVCVDRYDRLISFCCNSWISALKLQRPASGNPMKKQIFEYFSNQLPRSGFHHAGMLIAIRQLWQLCWTLFWKFSFLFSLFKNLCRKPKLLPLNSAKCSLSERLNYIIILRLATSNHKERWLLQKCVPIQMYQLHIINQSRPNLFINKSKTIMVDILHVNIK